MGLTFFHEVGLAENVCRQVSLRISAPPASFGNEFQNPSQGFRTSKPRATVALPDDKTHRLGSKTSSLVSAGLRGHERVKSRGAADFFDLSTIFLKRLPADVLGVSACTWSAAASLTPKYEKCSKRLPADVLRVSENFGVYFFFTKCG